MIKARIDLDEEKGFKTMVVLTDGDDNVFQGNFTKEINDQFGKKGIAINMVIFEGTQKEIDNAREQFEMPLANLTPAGSFLVAENHDKLAVELRKALRPQVKLFQINGNFVPLGKDFGVNLANEEALSWSKPLPQELGSYFDLTVQGQKKGLILDPGDCMEILLKQDKTDRTIYFERRLIAQLPGFEKKPRATADKWLLAVLQNKQVAAQGQRFGLEMLVTLEEWSQVKQGVDDRLAQYRPGFVWFELKAAGKTPKGLRWVQEWNRQGPAWKLQMTEWRKPEEKALPPQLEAWWIGNAKPVLFDTATYQELKDRKAVTKGKGKDTVTIESVDVEEREVRGGGVQTCLVVRLHYDLEQPVWVQLDKLVHAGEEHHFYPQAHKVTAVFYPVTAKHVEQYGYTLKLISLADFKRSTTLHIGGKELQLPVPDLDDGPPPVEGKLDQS
jgi:hypothetical protein